MASTLVDFIDIENMIAIDGLYSGKKLLVKLVIELSCGMQLFALPHVLQRSQESVWHSLAFVQDRKGVV